MDLDRVKLYLRIDTDADDDLLKLMDMAAQEYIKGAVGPCNMENPRVQMLYLAIMQDLHENRAYTITEAQKRRLAHTQASIILQLQCEQEEDYGG